MNDDQATVDAMVAANKDRALLAVLRERELERGGPEVREDDPIIFASEQEALRPLNRAERRAMVKQFAANLRRLPQVVPARNPTIRPKKRRKHR